MRFSPRFAIALTLLASICFMTGYLYSSQIPKVNAWLLVKIERESDKNLPVKLLPGAVQLQLFPIGLRLQNLRITPKKEMAEFFDPLAIETARIDLSFFNLIQGRFRVQELTLDSFSLNVRIPKTESKSDKPLEGLFKVLKQIPVESMDLRHMNLELQNESPRLSAKLNDAALIVVNNRNSLIIDFNTGSTLLAEHDNSVAIRVEAAVRTILRPNSIEVANLNIRRGETFVEAVGQVRGDTEALKFDTYDVEFNTSLALLSLRRWYIKSFPQETHIPEVEGFLSAKGTLVKNSKTPLFSQFAVTTQKLDIDNFFADQLQLEGKYEKNRATFTKATMSTLGLDVALKDLIIDVGDVTKISAQTEVTRFEVLDFLKTLKLHNVPVWLAAKGSVPCSGTISPEFEIKCQGSLQAENLLVKPDLKSKSTIAAIPKFAAQGEVTIDAEKVHYATDISMPNSKGRSEGTIVYKTGFDINYEASQLSLSDAKNTADLKLEGVARLKGSTKGNSETATFQMDLSIADHWFEDYWLGDVKTQVAYKQGIMTFQQVEGSHTTSRYQGDVTLNLNKNTLAVTGKIPFVESKDIYKAFSRKFAMPIEMTGTGTAEIKVTGPFRFNGLTYDLKSSLYRGTVAGESYDAIYFDVKARDGEVTAERVQLIKDKSTISLTGAGHPSGQIETVVKGRGLRLEQSNFVSSVGLDISGQVDFDMGLNGYVLEPETEMKGKIKQMSIGDQGVSDSNFRLKFTNKTIEGGGEFLGGVVKSEIKIPLNDTAPFLLNVETQNWNFAPLFAAISGPTSRRDFDAKLSSKIHLSAETGGFWNASGSIEVPQFYMRRGSQTLTAPEAISLAMEKGHLRVKNFRLEGENTFFKVTDNPNPQHRVDMQFNGKLDMALLALLMPFFEDIRGALSFTFSMKADRGFSELLGSAFIERGYMKFFDFPHPFEDLRADILFNQNKIVINSLKGELGGGRLAADGQLELKEYKNYPLQLSGSVERATFNVPDLFKTVGNAKFAITGSWFPFLLKGTYDVESGLITREFSAQDVGGGIRRSYYLPEFLLRESFVPLLLDLQVNFTRGVAIQNSQIDGSLNGQLSVKGNPAKASILGTVNLAKESKIIFRENTFELNSGALYFETPQDINPRMYISARSRVKEYDVNMVLQGTAKKPEPNLSSQPPLSQPDIISLLALGITAEKLESNVSSSEQGKSSSYQVGSAILSQNPIGKEIRNRFGVDVQFSTTYDSDNNVAVPKISVSRQFTPNFEASGARSIGQERRTEAQLKYRLTQKLSVIGSWEGREYEESSDKIVNKTEAPSKLGLDLEYKFDFK